MIKIFRKLHLWLSVPFGIIITLICFSGAMLIFEPEITRSVRSDVYYVAEVKDAPLDMGELMRQVKATLPDSVAIMGVTVASDKSRTWQVNLSKPRRASVFVDQYTGRITGSYERLGFFSTMFKMHRWLLDSANPHGEGVKAGKLLVGISTLIFVIALITGIVLWWQRARNNFGRSMRISFSKGWSGFWKGLHVAGGMYALIFVLAMALTGLTWSFDWYRTAFYAVCGVEHTHRNMGGVAPQQGKVDDGRQENREGGNRQENRGGDGHLESRGSEGHRGGRGDRRHRMPESATAASGMSAEAGERHMAKTAMEATVDSVAAAAEVNLQKEPISEFVAWQTVYDKLIAANPSAPQITLSSGKATVTLGTTGNSRASDRYSFDTSTGDVSLSSRYADSVEAVKLRGWIYSIHTGSLGGMITRIIWLLGALLGATLPLTGYYIWIKKLLKS